MTDTPFFQNSLAWVHYRMRGGMRSAVLQSGGFLAIMGGLILTAVRANPSDARSILYGWVIGLLALQTGILLLYGGSAVRNAIRKDVTTGMMASHRLMPVAPAQAVAGYLLGSCVQPLAIAAANLLLGVLIAGPAGLSPLDWVLANGLLLLFAVCAWVVVACASLISAKSAGAVLIVVVLIPTAGGFLLTLVPAFTMVCSPLVGSTIFGTLMWGAAWSSVLHLSIVAQLAVTALFYIAACRAYRRDDVAAFGPLLGMVMLAALVVISVVGIRNWPALQPMISGMTGDVRTLQTLGSLTAGLMLAFLPITAAAWLEEDYRRRKRLDDPALGRKPANGIMLALCSAGLVGLIPVLTPAPQLSAERVLVTFVCLAVALAAITYLLRLIYRAQAGASLLLALWIAVVWIGPWVVSFGVLVAYGLDEALELPRAWSRSEVVASFSPVGALISAWTGEGRRYLPGVAFQAGLAVVMALLYHAHGRRLARATRES